MNQTERDLIIRFAHVEGLGPRTFHDILGEFESLSKFFSLTDVGFLRSEYNKKAKEWKTRCYEFDIDKWKNDLHSRGIKTLVFGEVDYPYLLSKIHSPPLILYYLGELKNIDLNNCISVVGTRRTTAYGKMMTNRIVRDLINHNLTIVSGMAYGIDRAAHKSALENDGKTVAVLASSVDDPTPYGNKDIYEKIIKKGLIISEVEPGQEIADFSFPKRNRIIAGLSPATLVVEAPEKSGALITANVAFEEDRLVFAVPGDAARYNSIGANNLIKCDKARLVTSAKEIFEDLGYALRDETYDITYKLNAMQRSIVNELRMEAKSVDQIASTIDMKVNDLLASIAELEIKGIIKLNERMKYILVI